MKEKDIIINQSLDFLFKANQKGVSNYKIAQETKITEATIGNYVKKKTKPTLANAKILVDYFVETPQKLYYECENIIIQFYDNIGIKEDLSKITINLNPFIENDLFKKFLNKYNELLIFVGEQPFPKLNSSVLSSNVLLENMKYIKSTYIEKGAQIEPKRLMFPNMANEDAVPLYDVAAAAGYKSFDEMISKEKLVGNFVIPGFKNIDWMIYVTGSSMYPKYSSGDIIGCRILRESRFIQWGKVYVIATQEQGILVKRLEQSKKKDCIKAISDNKNYGSFDIPKNEILGIALVVGVVRLE